MAMPTRLDVLLHSRKSAAAGAVDEMMSGSAATALAKSPPRTRFATITRLISSADSFSIGAPVNDDGAKVGHVGERRARYEQVADDVEKPRGIVVGEKRGGIEAEPFGPNQGRIVDKGPGWVIRPAPTAIGSICIGRHCGNAVGPGEVDGERQGVFLVRTAAAAALNGHGQLAPREDRHAAARRRMVAGQPGVFGGDLARLPLQAVAEHDAVISRLLRALPGGR